ncbi:hypothetical protein DCS_08100 [Drechmeria coniospora]|uniref:Alpha/beta hydrolase fold-3 domain-containing protein n=1 Tax=Drechmeria coniospora TaxID=98403 RepID=A0A151GG99_DRECN|nr:hypothetical protein DCS_08100 [Drechmeria coniospora]KYK56133.1 hypothetical protein DCS_08100 [Drechmeria coniospora]
MYLYAARNFSALVGLASPEPMSNMYDPTYFRATWVLTALDAGFWTAMKIRTKWLRDVASVVFSLFYLVAAERADEKVRKVRGMVTVDHMRVSWNKGTTPYLGFVQRLLRPRFTRWPPRQIRIPRPASSDYKEPVAAWLYYDGPIAHLEHHNRIILDVPGGGFVAMDPRCNDDKLFAWAAKTGLPVISLDYRKAPEYPYPYALNECFDVYAAMVKTNGRCVGMSGKDTPRIIITGDSAGGNLAVASTLMILETSTAQFRRYAGAESLPPPDGLVCFYPALDMNIGNWMSDEQMSLIRDRKMRDTNGSIMRRKSMQYNELVGTPHQSDDDDDTTPPLVVVGERAPRPSKRPAERGGEAGGGRTDSMSHHAAPMRTRLATSSTISYFNDRVLTPELMRAMIILYIGAHNRPDFAQDYLLSPVLAPESLLAKFPKTYFMTGERDPLVDDTVVFASRLRRAKEAAVRERVGDERAERMLDDIDAAEVMLIPRISHGFMQFPSIYPPAWKHFERCAAWFEQLFADAEHARTRNLRPEPLSPVVERAANGSHHRRNPTVGESSGDEDKPLEISMTRLSRGRSVTQPSQPEANGKSSGKPTFDLAEGRQRSSPARKGRKSLSKNMSLVKLNSTDDLLGRRMQGLASGLTGPEADG